MAERKMPDLPGNSYKERREKTEEFRKQRVEGKKVIKGNLVKQNKSTLTKFKETFLGETLSNVGNFMLNEVLIPSAKSAISDMLHGATDMMIPTGKRSRYDSRGRESGQKIRYDRASYDDDRDDRPSRRRAEYENITLERRSDADYVLDLLIDHIREYGDVSIAVLYEAVGIKDEHTDQNYGWTSLRRARVVPVRDGFWIDLPRPVLLER